VTEYNRSEKISWFLPAALFLLMLSNYTSAQTINMDSIKIQNYSNVAGQIVTTALKERKGYELLRELCMIGPRLSGSKNSLEAINWAFEKMKTFGFDSVWLQPAMVPHWERGDTESCTIINENKNLSVLALGGSVSTSEEGITAEVIEVKDFDELEKRKDELKDKIVFFNNTIDAGLVDTFSGYGKIVKQRTEGAIESAKYGAVGVLIKSITTKYDNVPHTGVMSYVDSIPKIPSAALGFQDAEYLSKEIKNNPHLKINFKLSCKTLPDAKSYNVICEIKGSEKPNEIIVVGGHLDSWDVGYGAHDDGAGCIQSLEVLDLFKRLNIKPKRTIRCVFFINEENGSRGAREYEKIAEQSGEKHIAAIESDRGGFTPEGFYVDTDSSLVFDILQSWLPVLEKAGISWIKKGGSGSDVGKIKNTAALIGYVPDDQKYFDFHHSDNDVFEEVHPRELELGTAAITVLTYLLSEEL